MLVGNGRESRTRDADCGGDFVGVARDLLWWGGFGKW